MEGLREEIMINQFMVVAGCAADQARQILTAAHWQFETALSIFLQDAALPACPSTRGSHFNLVTPCNTPATPPNFPDTLLAFSRMSAQDKASSPPNTGMLTDSRQQQQQQSGPQFIYARNPFSHSNGEHQTLNSTSSTTSTAPHVPPL